MPPQNDSINTKRPAIRLSSKNETHEPAAGNLWESNVKGSLSRPSVYCQQEKENPATLRFSTGLLRKPWTGLSSGPRAASRGCSAVQSTKAVNYLRIRIALKGWLRS